MRPLSWVSFAGTAGVTMLGLLVSGCGAGTLSSVSNVEMVPLSGVAHGGPNPIIGATVTLYETQVGDGTTAGSPALSTYGSAGKVLATAVTGSYGQFTFTGTYTCDTAPYMQYAYVAVTGGSTGGGGGVTNNNSVLVAALGSCLNLATVGTKAATQIFVSEGTTVAAGYALSNFATVTGLPGAQVVNIGSTPTNDAITPGCTGTGTTLSCKANGLGHAFANAVGLASSVSFAAANSATGLINASMPGYTGSAIPQAMLNIVADALQSCVNSTGGAAGDSPADPCGTLFADTTSLAGTAPTDTLSAVMSLAKYPTNSAATNATTGLFSLVTASSYFQPTLVLSPGPYTLGVQYPASTTFPYPQSLALDIADNVYVLAANGNSTLTTGTGVVPISATGLGALGYSTSGQIAPLFSANLTNTATYILPGFLAVDSNNNVYATNQGLSTGGQNALRVFNGPANILAGAATGGAATSTFTTVVPTYSPTPAAINNPSSIAIDRSNNIWIGTGSAATSNAMYQLAAPASPATATTINSLVYTASISNAFGIYGMAVDQYQNIWGCTQGGSLTVSKVKTTYNSLMLAYPAAGSTPGLTLLSGSNATAGPKATSTEDGLSIDAAGNAYCAVGNGMQSTPSLGGNTATSLPAVQGFIYTASATLANNPSGGEIDGNGTFWEGGYSAAPSLFGETFAGTGASFAPTSTTSVTIKGDVCYPVDNTTGTNGTAAIAIGYYCLNNATGFSTTTTPPKGSIIQDSDWTQIDSTGSIWLPEGVGAAVAVGTPVGIVQIIGTAAPVWPLLSYGQPGVKP